MSSRRLHRINSDTTKAARSQSLTHRPAAADSQARQAVNFGCNIGLEFHKCTNRYFTVVGLLCYLLGIRQADHITRDPLVGQIFENLVVIEFLKTRYNGASHTLSGNRQAIHFKEIDEID